MQKHARYFSALFLELRVICNYVVFRNLFQPEFLEDVEECGILGSKEYTPTLPASRQANANRNLTPYEDEDTIQECCGIVIGNRIHTTRSPWCGSQNSWNFLRQQTILFGL